MSLRSGLIRGLSVLALVSATLTGCHSPRAAGAASASAATPEPSLQDLGLRTFPEIFPGAQAGALPRDVKLHVWFSKDLDVYVGVDPRSGWTDTESHAVFTALRRLQAAQPTLYDVVFLQSRGGGTSHLSLPRPAGWTNLNQTAAFVVVAADFQEPGKRAIASNQYLLGTPTRDVYVNLPFIGLNPEVIRGDVPGWGPSEIYASLTPDAARERYLREGLLDSLMHERVHGYISQFHGHDRLFAALRPPVQPQPLCEYELEEYLVKRFLLEAYARERTAFSADFWSYWKQDLSLLGTRVLESSCYQNLRGQGLLNTELIQTSVP